MEGKKLSLGVKIGYGVCDFGGNLFFTATAFVLMIYITDTMGLKAGLAGTALFIGRIWDAFYDTVIGYVSDRTRTRLGRRRPYMLAGAVPLGIAMILMFTNPALFKENLSQAELFIFTTLVYIFLCTAYSTVNIPYCSMTPELTDDYHERTSLTGYRFGFAAIGTLMGAGAAWPIVGLLKDKNMGFILLGAVYGGIMMVTALTTVFTTKEPVDLKPAGSVGFFKTYLEVFKNKPYLIILSTYILHIIAITIVSQVAAYYFDYVLAARNVMNPKDEITKAMLILIGTAFLFIPVSVFMSKKLGKKLVYGAGFFIMSAGLVALFMFGDKQPISFTMIMMLIMGVGARPAVRTAVHDSGRRDRIRLSPDGRTEGRLVLRHLDMGIKARPGAGGPFDGLDTSAHGLRQRRPAAGPQRGAGHQAAAGSDLGCRIHIGRSWCFISIR